MEIFPARKPRLGVVILFHDGSQPLRLRRYLKSIEINVEFSQLHNHVWAAVHNVFCDINHSRVVYLKQDIP